MIVIAHIQYYCTVTEYDRQPGSKSCTVMQLMCGCLRFTVICMYMLVNLALNQRSLKSVQPNDYRTRAFLNIIRLT